MDIFATLGQLQGAFLSVKEKLIKKVDAIDGKGLSTNDFSDELKEKVLNAQTSQQVEIAVTSKGYQTAPQVEAIIAGKNFQTLSDVQTAIANIDKLVRTRVDALPPKEDAKINVIYQVPKILEDGSKIYEEYMFTDGDYDPIGSTGTDLSDYYNTKNLRAATDEEVQAMLESVFGA